MRDLLLRVTAYPFYIIAEACCWVITALKYLAQPDVRSGRACIKWWEP